MKTMRTALLASVVTLVLTGFLYPLVVTVVGGILFPSGAAGSFVNHDTGREVGSELIGQAFAKPGYFQPRPSAAGTGYDATSSGGSNLGPASQKLRSRVQAEVQRLRAENPDAQGEIPNELVAASGSGLDPHLSPEAVRWQIPRVARARGIAPQRIEPIVNGIIEGRALGFLGEPRVNVLRLNLALDRQFGKLP